MSLTSYRAAPPRVSDALVFSNATQRDPLEVSPIKFEFLDAIVEDGLLCFAGLATTYSPRSWDIVPLALKRLTAEFGMGSGLIASPKATRPAKHNNEANGISFVYSSFLGHIPIQQAWRLLGICVSGMGIE
jgi:hypothetical protein